MDWNGISEPYHCPNYYYYPHQYHHHHPDGALVTDRRLSENPYHPVSPDSTTPSSRHSSIASRASSISTPYTCADGTYRVPGDSKGSSTAEDRSRLYARFGGEPGAGGTGTDDDAEEELGLCEKMGEEFARMLVWMDG